MLVNLANLLICNVWFIDGTKDAGNSVKAMNRISSYHLYRYIGWLSLLKWNYLSYFSSSNFAIIDGEAPCPNILNYCNCGMLSSISFVSWILMLWHHPISSFFMFLSLLNAFIAFTSFITGTFRSLIIVIYSTYSSMLSKHSIHLFERSSFLYLANSEFRQSYILFLYELF